MKITETMSNTDCIRSLLKGYPAKVYYRYYNHENLNQYFDCTKPVKDNLMVTSKNKGNQWLISKYDQPDKVFQFK